MARSNDGIPIYTQKTVGQSSATAVPNAALPMLIATVKLSLAVNGTDDETVLGALQAEFLRDALYRFLPSATLDRVNRVIKRLQAGKFEGTLGRSAGNSASTSR